MQNILMTDSISRKAAIDAFYQYPNVNWTTLDVMEKIKELPSAQPEEKPIDYQDCSDALLRMWMDNVITDGEYWRIMDKLNAHWEKEG